VEFGFIGALSLKCYAMHMFSVCWNDALDVFLTIKEVNQSGQFWDA